MFKRTHQNPFKPRPGLVFILLALFSLQALAGKPLSHSKILNCLPLYNALNTGHFATRPNKELAKILKTAKTEIEGLNYMGLVVWKPKEITDFQRKLVRYHNVEKYAAKIPVFDKAQKEGEAIVLVDDLRFSQLGCKNESEGGFTVINNAKAFKNGTLKVEDLPALRVWRDVDGKIWTLDHRRLAAMKLSGAVKEAKVVFVSEETVNVQRFKFDTQTDGKTIFVRVENPDEEALAIIVGKDIEEATVKTLKANKRAIETPNREAAYAQLLNKFPFETRTKWLDFRGPEHIKKLKMYAKELGESLAELEKTSAPQIKGNFSTFGEVAVRGKGEMSILAKLIRKDMDAYLAGKAGITNLKSAIAALGDSLGSRVIMKADETGKIDPKDVQAFVDKVDSDIRGGLRVTEIMNYRARGNGAPYLTDAQIKQLIKADQDFRLNLMEAKKLKPEIVVPDPIIVKSGPSASFETGYTSFHMNIQYPSGVQAEMQLKGKLMHDASEIQHFVYDLKSGKVLNEKLASNPAIAKAAKDFRALSLEQKQQVMVYVEEQLKTARRIETGAPKGPVYKLPVGLPQSLTFENLRPHLLHD